MDNPPNDSGTSPKELGQRSVVAHFDVLSQPRKMQIMGIFGLE